MLKLTRLCAICTVAAIGLAACSSSGGGDDGGPTPGPSSVTTSQVGPSPSAAVTTPASGGEVDACALSADEVSEVMGFSLELAENTGSSCNYQAAKSETDHIGSSVSFSVSPVVGGEEIYREVADSVANTFETEAEDLDGIGDAAFGIDAGFVYEIIAFQSDTQVVLAVTATEGDVADEAKQLIVKLLG